ncbi:MAG: transposase [Chitinivibrionales bacterium]|nr:transposase [Chitinivibrionales bacterium]
MLPRANRHFLPDHIWHITHRCHNKAFLLKFSEDRTRWISWLNKAVKKHGLSVLNYTVTCNHIHLLVFDTGKADAIWRSMQLDEGCTAENYNARKDRKGAFWEDRYHATAVQSGNHLIRCMIYIDNNMIRAGEVKKPEDWLHCGYREIRSRRPGTRIIDMQRLKKLANVKSKEEFIDLYQKIKFDPHFFPSFEKRQEFWTSSIAVGDKNFIDSFTTHLDKKGKGRQAVVVDDSKDIHVLKEPGAEYLSETNEQPPVAGISASTFSIRGDNLVSMH